MKASLIFSLALILGMGIGYQYADSRYSEVKRKLGELTDTDIEEYLQLKANKAEYDKADEILGKAILIFLADLGLRISPEAKAFALSAATGSLNTSATAPAEPIQTPKPPSPPAMPAIEQPNSEANTSFHAKNKLPNLSASHTSSVDHRSERQTQGIVGRVSFNGVKPNFESIKMSADPGCVATNGGLRIPKEDFVVNPNSTLANVFVYIKEGINKQFVSPTPTEPVILNQSGCRYFPHVFGIQVGQTLEILNSDSVLHNVHSMAKLNAPFNMGMATKYQKIEKRFTKPETMVKIKCDVHGWMSAYVGVLDHPYFSVTDSAGEFNIKLPPPGEYLIEAWHEKLGTRSQRISVTQGQVTYGLPFQFPN